MMRRGMIFVAIALHLLAGPALTQTAPEAHLPLDGWISEDGTSVNLSWRDTPRAHRGTVEISRRPLGEVGAKSWRVLDLGAPESQRITDTTTRRGVAYEYRVLRHKKTGGILDAGYWIAGRDVPAVTDRGTVHLIVDPTVLEPITPYLVRFRRDLIGAGWQTNIYSGSRSGTNKENLTTAIKLRGQLKAAFSRDRFARHVVILIGHMPVLKSGSVNPDGHERLPHATDLIYGDLDGRWRINAQGDLLDNALPSSFIEMQVGRIDFANMAAQDPEREIQLLQAYFDKDHHWRHGRLGDLRAAYGKVLTNEIYGLRNLVGPGSVTKGGHHDVGEERPWLWGVDFGDPAGQIYADTYSNKAVFALNFGSHKQRFDARSNAMTALLAQPGYPLAVGWGQRPVWWPHLMALGGTIGDVHMRTVNNGMADDAYPEGLDYIPTGKFIWRNPVWVNLLGDPTLHAYPLAPPQNVVAEQDGPDVLVTWTPSPDPDVLGYRVYKRPAGAEDFILISGDTLVTGGQVRDARGGATDVYQVRAYGRKEVYAGSFFTYSQGIFAAPARPPLQTRDIELTVQAGQTVALPARFNAPQGQKIYSLVGTPRVGRIAHKDGAWHYSAPPEFSGTVQMPFVVSDDLSSADGTVSVSVTP